MSRRKPLDLTKYKRPSTAAKKLYEWCRERAKEIGQNPDTEVALFDPERGESLGYGKCWRVSWEAGPYHWAIALSGGGTYLAGECGYRDAHGNYIPPEVLLTESEHWTAEPYYSFDLGFYPN